MKNFKLQDDYWILFRNSVGALSNYLRQNPNIRSLIIGISGGVDSAVVAAVAHKACLNFENIEVKGFSMPLLSNKSDERSRAEAIGKDFCHTFRVVDLRPSLFNTCEVVDPSLIKEAPHDKDRAIQLGNLKARTRMMFLYHQAARHKGMVLSTDNLTEYNLGFWTLHGDVGDYGPIQELWKTEVYGIANQLPESVRMCANAVPTDGLGITNSDLDQLLPSWEGSHTDGYKHVDLILIDRLSGLKSYDQGHGIVKRHIATQFKRNNPTGPTRDELVWKF